MRSMTKSSVAKDKSHRAHRRNPYKLAHGLPKHPDRQLSGVGHAGRWAQDNSRSTFDMRHAIFLHHERTVCHGRLGQANGGTSFD